MRQQHHRPGKGTVLNRSRCPALCELTCLSTSQATTTLTAVPFWILACDMRAPARAHPAGAQQVRAGQVQRALVRHAQVKVLHPALHPVLPHSARTQARSARACSQAHAHCWAVITSPGSMCMLDVALLTLPINQVSGTARS